MNHRDLPSLLGDLEDLASRLKDAGVPTDVVAHVVNAQVGLRLLIMRGDRESVPPLVEQNQPARNAATQAFRNVRKLLKDVR